ncbi:baseplate J/gp47 family protein [Terracoccus sp. 273MFTsu3.1]|uniref:baseplate J/gp47 family protein n=1 Tax=Terracoccus sp. 273MFTsu3.1 TaxID=1172188 RepID=UPI00037C3A24|nr:baseplate J/gp47 family protein [Terracoccus sp. 273MFTsu3.1]
MSSVQATIDYTSKDYDGLKASMLDFAAQVIPEWRSRSEGDFGVALVELLAYEGDILSYYGDRIQDEAFLSTATRRESLLQLAAMLGYQPSNGVSATGTVTLQSANPGPAVVVPAGTDVVTDFIADIDGRLVFETDTAVTVPANGGTVQVTVTEGGTRSMVSLGASNGLPSQSFRLPETGVLTGSVRVFVDRAVTATGTNVEEWTQVDFLVDSDSTSRTFSVSVDADGASSILFGDGTDGMVPNTGLNVYATYKTTSGSAGNLSAGNLISVDSPSLAGVYVAQDTNGAYLSTATAGGADPETNDQIRANAPRAFRSQRRLVTLKDFADAAIAVPGVLRANASAGAFSSVSVWIVGASGGQPTTDLINRVQANLNSKVLAGVTPTVGTPTFVKVNVGAAGANALVVKVYDNVKQGVVKANVETAIRSLLALANVDFAQRLTVSDFYSAIMSVPGVQYVVIPMIARSDSAQTGTADIVCRDWEIPTLGNLVVTATGGIL